MLRVSSPSTSRVDRSFRVAAIGKFIAVAAILLANVVSPASAQQLLRDAEIEQWLDDYSLPIFRAAGLPAEQVNIWLIGDQTPNAFAGGLNMGVHTGLITLADTPNQIEGVIAHEAAHIAGGHSARSDDVLAAASRPIFLSLALAAGAIAAGAPEAGIGILGLGQNIGQANLLKYSRGQESTADQAAVTYLDNLGRSSAGLIEFFGKLSNNQIIRGFRANPYAQTHPLALSRITALTERATKSPYYDVKDSPEDIARLQLIQGKIWGFLEEPRFTLREYPETDTSAPARYARTVAYFRSSEIDKALAEIDSLIAERPDFPYFHELKGQILFEYGRVPESIEPHRQSVKLAPDKALLRVNLGRALIATEDLGRYEEAITILKSAVNIEKDNSFAWFELSRAHGALGQIGKAHLATAEARYHRGDKVGANQFAKRAMGDLERNSPDWRRAVDIIYATQGDAQSANDQEEQSPRGSRKPEAPRREGDVPDPNFH